MVSDEHNRGCAAKVARTLRITGGTPEAHRSTLFQASGRFYELLQLPIWREVCIVLEATAMVTKLMIASRVL